MCYCLFFKSFILFLSVLHKVQEMHTLCVSVSKASWKKKISRQNFTDFERFIKLVQCRKTQLELKLFLFLTWTLIALVPVDQFCQFCADIVTNDQSVGVHKHLFFKGIVLHLLPTMACRLRIEVPVLLIKTF